jgi:hypothetical protein
MRSSVTNDKARITAAGQIPQLRGEECPRHIGFPPAFSIAFHKESRPSTASAQRRAGFLLMLCKSKRRVCDIQARCSVSPARALRQSWRFLVILEGELPGGFLQNAFSAHWLPGRCGLLTESSTHGRTGRWPPQCCRLICEDRFANGGLLNACLVTLFGAMTDHALPHASCVERGYRIFRLAMRLGWLARAAFVLGEVVGL